MLRVDDPTFMSAAHGCWRSLHDESVVAVRKDADLHRVSYQRDATGGMVILVTSC